MRSANLAAFLLSAALPSLTTALTDSKADLPLAAPAVGGSDALAEFHLAARDLSQDPGAEHLQKRFWTALFTAAPAVISTISSLFKKKDKRDLADFLNEYNAAHPVVARGEPSAAELADLLASYAQVAARSAPQLNLPPGWNANVLAVYDQNGNAVYDKSAPAKRSAPEQILGSFDLTKNLAASATGVERRDAAPAPADAKVMALFSDDGKLLGYFPPKTAKRDLPAGVEDQAQAMAVFDDDGTLVGVYPAKGAQKRGIESDEADFDEAADEADIDEADTEHLARRVVGMRGAPIGWGRV